MYGQLYFETEDFDMAKQKFIELSENKRRGDFPNEKPVESGLFSIVLVENSDNYIDTEYRFKATGQILCLEETKDLLNLVTKAVK
jgi:hypothetical protein